MESQPNVEQKPLNNTAVYRKEDPEGKVFIQAQGVSHKSAGSETLYKRTSLAFLSLWIITMIALITGMVLYSLHQHRNLKGKDEELEHVAQQHQDGQIQLKDLNRELVVKNQQLQGRDVQLMKRKQEIQERDKQLRSIKEQVKKRSQQLQNKDTRLKDKNQQLKEAFEELSQKNEQLKSRERDLNERRRELELKSRDNTKLAQQVKALQGNLKVLAWKWIRTAAVDVTLDPDTAHASLILSEDGKQVRHGDEWQNVPDNPERFNPVVCVLGKPGFSSGRVYYEVWVGGKTEWDVGVAKESISRKGDITLSPRNGYWTICLRNGTEYLAPTDFSVSLSLSEKLQKVGVYVDYEGGQVSFYNAETSSHIYSHTNHTFTDKLYPFFSPALNDGGTNSAPLIITPVSEIH